MINMFDEILIVIIALMLVAALFVVYLNFIETTNSMKNIFLKSTHITINQTTKSTTENTISTSSNTIPSNSISETSNTIITNSENKAQILQKEAVQNCTGNENYNKCYIVFFVNKAIEEKNASICLDMNMSYLGNATYDNITYSWNDINKDWCLISYINYYKINTLNNYTICNLFTINSDKQLCLKNES